MKFLQLCLCSSLVAAGISPLHAQQALTPEQQKQAIEALRKALDQAPGPVSAPAGVKVIPPAETLPSSDVKPVEKSAAQASKDAEAKAKADAKLKAKADAEQKRLLEDEKRAADQQKRYEAKRQAELEAQAKRDAEARAKKEMKAKTEVEAQAPKATTPIVVQTPAPAVTTSVTASAPVLSADQNSAAREALRRALDQPTAATVPAAAPKIEVQPEVKTPAATPATVVAVTPPGVLDSTTTVVEPAAPALSQKDAEAARSALRSKLETYEATMPPSAVTPGVPTVPAVETKLPATKSQRLSELLNSYRRDQITPAEYHSQRAKILAEPN